MAHQIAGFWIRLFTRTVDFIIPLGIAFGLVFALTTSNVSGGRSFIAPYAFYLWMLFLAGLILFFGWGLPLMLKGRTLGMLLTRTFVISEHNLFITWMRRELIFSAGWAVLVLIGMALINHTLVDKFVLSSQVSTEYSALEQLRISVFSTVGGILAMSQLVCGVSIIVSKEHLGLHDRFSQSKTVWKNRFLPENLGANAITVLPQPVNNVIIEWVNGE